MTVNMGMIDRTIRALVGLALIAFALDLLLPNTGWNWIGWVGIVPLVTAILGNCPAYTVLGISTCTRRSPVH
jgi:hypothetical protein